MRLNNQKGDRRREPRFTARDDARVEVGAATLEPEAVKAKRLEGRIIGRGDKIKREDLNADVREP